VKTATLDDLKTRLATIVGWVERGEDVMVKGKRLPQPTTPQTSVDWSKSAAFRDRTGEPVLTRQDLDELFEDMRGPY